MNLAPGGEVNTAAREPLPELPPKAAPEPRRRLGQDPDALFTSLTSNDALRTRDALNALGLPWLAGRMPPDVRLLAVNLDSDADLERILIVKAGLDAAAIVLKKETGAWWQLGSFTCCIGTGQVDPFVELKATVWYGTMDLIVHRTAAHGTGVGEFRLSVYRVWRSHLYRVLDVVESAYNLTSSEESRVIYPNIDSTEAPRVLTIHRVTRMGDRLTTACFPYRWDPAQFVFLRIAAARVLCTLAN